ncbi:MAG: helix-turn-helix domain-containing protein [Firmicutes bacterium]|nr:helix-turn-helix domain-containing protein [Bacillota bacterium]
MENLRKKYVDNNLIGNRLKELRAEKGLTLVELANQIGVTHTIISRWERSVYIPSVFAVVALAEFFDVTTDYLLCKTN